MAETALVGDATLLEGEQRRGLRGLTHPIVVAFGLANLYLLALTGPLISLGHDLVYHLTGSASAIFIPVMIDVVALFVLFAALLLIAERGGRVRVVVWSCLVLPLPWVLSETVVGFLGDQVPGWVKLLARLLCVAAIMVMALRWQRWLSAFEVARSVAAMILGVFSLSGLFIFAQLVWFGWQARDLNPSPVLHHAEVAAAQPRQRVVWILLDELSYQQIYEQRYPGLELPAFDQLAAQSTVFTQVVPTGEYTRFIIPSLLTGVPSDGVGISGTGLLMAMHNTTSKRWGRFQQRETIFQDAIDAGYSTGVAGWYNPYCRILPAVLDHCYWMYHEATPADLSPAASVAANLKMPFRMFAAAVLHLFGDGPGPESDEVADVQMHTADYRELLKAGDGFLADPSINFLLLHMPVPHPFGFYDRKDKTFSSGHTSYIDNLALADAYLAHVRKVLEQQDAWDSTTVVVMGDHSWRTSLIWSSTAGWSAEDQAASHGGQFDDRPAYIVKLPHEQVGARVDARFSAIRTRALFDAILQNQVRTPEELRGWVLQR